MRNALVHPFSLTLLAASLVSAGLMLSVLDRWSGQAWWVLVLGLLAYAASTAVLHRWHTIEGQATRTDDISTEIRADADPEQSGRELPSGVVDEALRHLNDPAFLAQSELASLLSETLASVPSQGGGDRTSRQLTHLESAQALREVIIAAIEQLRPAGGSVGDGSSQALQYHILHEAYVQRRPVAHILTRYSIGEASYYRNRRAAVSAVARHLQSKEALIRGSQVKAIDS